MQCSRGQVYEACGSSCDRTCRALSEPEPGCEGEKVCEEGCFCPPGKYLSTSGECVTADLCSCQHDGQIYQPNDVFADHNSIWCVAVHQYAETVLKSCFMTSLLSLVFVFVSPATVRMAPCIVALLKWRHLCLIYSMMMKQSHPEV